MLLCAHLPEELVLEILSRIPAKSLVRFKSVCRSWRKIIGDPYFVVKHHQTRKAITNNGCFFSRCYYKDIITRHPWCFLYRGGESAEIRFEEIYPPYQTKKAVLSAEADGIFYVYGGDDDDDDPAAAAADGKFYIDNGFVPRRIGTFSLWNPSTRESKTITPYASTYPDLTGLGFDSKSGDLDLKVLHTYTLRTQDWSFLSPNSEQTSMAKAVVWTSREGFWRELDNISPLKADMRSMQKQLYIKGRCYWYITSTAFCHIKRTAMEQESILCFDIADEKFQLFPLPDTDNNSYGFSIHMIIELKQSIGFVNFHSGGDKSFDIWLMSHEVGVGDSVSWSKYLTLQIPWPTSSYGSCDLKLFLMEREVIFWDASRNFFFQNLSTRKTTFFKKKFHIVSNTFIVYNESMISFKVRNQKRSSLENESKSSPKKAPEEATA